jgi:TonB-linked SusC/RagA family outer membrane protein
MKDRTTLKRMNWIPLLMILFWGITSGIQAQDTLLVKGIIRNGAQKPVPNVSVGIQGSFELPAITDEAGEFAIKTISPNALLNINPSSRYKQKRVFLNNRDFLEIYLTENDVPSGDDPLVILSQQILRRNVISSYDVVSTENILATPSFTIDQYLQGRVSGMNVVNRSGDPASGASAFIRGINSLNASSQPLYVIDGMPITSFMVFGSLLDGYTYNPLLSLNPLDVSRVTVVKDPVVTSAYGSKASNGLVLIETLNPSSTETVINLDVRTGYSLTPSRNIPQLDAGEHRTLINEVLFSSGMNEERVKEKYPSLFLNPNDNKYIDYQHDTKWQDLIFSEAAFRNINIGVQGGDEIARYGLSFGYLDGEGIIKSTGYQGYNIRFLGLLNIFSWLKMNTGVSLSYNSSDLKESAKISETSPILTSLGKSPMLNPFRYDTQGRELTLLAEVDELGVSNPLAVINNYEASNTNFNFLTTIGLEATLKQNLILKTNIGITYNLLKEKIFMPNLGMEGYYKNEAHNVSKAANNTFSSFFNNTYLYFEKSFGSDISISSSTGINILTNDFGFDWALTKNSHINDQYRMLQDGTNNLREIGGQNRTWNWVSFYENFNFNYRDKYLATLTFSVDGSSRIGENAANTIKISDLPFGFFYAAGGAWRLSNESFLKNKKWLEELKLRVSYGLSGNDDIGEANAARFYDVVRFREVTGLYPAVKHNEELTYETVAQLNGGLDISILGSRVKATLDVYRSTIDNMLVYKPLEAFFGYEYQPVNGGKMQNTGIDLTLFYRVIDKPDFKWDIQASYATFRNEILEFTVDKLSNVLPGSEVVNIIGEKANSFYGYVFEGVYASKSEAASRGLVNEKLVPYGAGDAIYADISGPGGVPDKVINQYDKTIIGSPYPEHFGGFTNTFKYKRWTLEAFLQGVYGNEVFNYVRYKNESMSGIQNQSANVLNRWQYDGQVTTVPRALYNDPVGNTLFSSRWVENGSYLRIKNVSLSYFVPNNFLTFRNALFYVSASNLFTFSEYLGYDPEFSYSHSTIEQGIDYGLTPQPRQFIVGVKFGL